MKKALKLSFDEYLYTKSIDRSSLQIAVEKNVEFEENDILFISGSVAEGYANHLSDIDLYLLTKRKIPTIGNTGLLTFTCGSGIIDLEPYNPDNIYAIINELHSWKKGNQLDDPRIAMGFEGREILHRILVGIPLAGNEQFWRIKNQIDTYALTRVSFDMAKQSISTAQQDLAGVLDSNDAPTAYFACQRLLGFAIDALLAKLGSTNPKTKWRTCLLSTYAKPGWDRDLPGGELKEDIIKYVLRLSSTHVSCIRDARKLARECISFSNRIIPWAQTHFYSDNLTTSPTQTSFIHKQHGTTIRINSNKQKLPALAPDVQVSHDSDGELQICSFRRHKYIPIENLTQEALCYFNGESTIENVVTHLSNKTVKSPADISIALKHLVRVLADSGFLDNS